MAFNRQQTKRAQAVVVIALLVLVIAVAAVVLSGAFLRSGTAGSGASDTGSAQQSTEASGGVTSSTSTSSSSQIDSMDDVDAYYGAATTSLQTTYDADAANPAALLNLANGYFDWGSAAMAYAQDDDDSEHVRDLFNQAIELYDRYLEQNPESNSVIVDRAISIFYTGDHAKAIETLEEFTQNNASFAAAWANLGMFYETDGQTDKAKDAYQKAVDTATDDTVKNYAQTHLDSLGE